ncbi:MAG: hypothetical protein LQ342_003341 [Letrouitia transgressa]|nr:MAG: hypothetical protein LQ342_003341 [Letrouitia transgressa]
MIRNEELQYLCELPSEIRSAIARGVSAWEKLKTKAKNTNLDGQPSVDKLSGTYTNLDSVRTVPQSGHQSSQGSMQCPFSALRGNQSNGWRSYNNVFRESRSSSKAQQSSEAVDQDPIKADVHHIRSSSSSVSAIECASNCPRCPIRFLDQHSPEEVAQYFKNHSHELPRSHEICVKRYQRNEESIRQLDHKYGDLVNMIQSLGQKHQPLLSPKQGGGPMAPKRSLTERDGTRADTQKPPGLITEGTDAKQKDEDREGHFERSLREIRVGESPSRPWGISVPQPVNIPSSVVSAKEEAASELAPQPDIPTPTTPLQEQHMPRKETSSQNPQQLFFTGPVFVGYTAEQAAQVLQR